MVHEEAAHTPGQRSRRDVLHLTPDVADGSLPDRGEKHVVAGESKLVGEQVRHVARPGIGPEEAGVARRVKGLNHRVEGDDRVDVVGKGRSNDDRAGGRKGDEHPAL